MGEDKLKRLLLAGTAFLGLAASSSVARATLFDFTYAGSLVDFTVPATDTYQILAFGAQGGSGGKNAASGIGAGGRGAEIGGDFSLTAGEILQIAVGGAGSNGGGDGGGGGGGSLVVGPGNTPLVIAGGGGGGGGNVSNIGLPGQGGLTGPDGGGGTGGTAGNGGGGGNELAQGGGGGGFFSVGGNAVFGGTGGGAFPGLAGGESGGGFGGGGGADFGAAVEAATAAVVGAFSHQDRMVPVVVVAPLTRAQTRSWPPISRPAMARS